MSSDALSSATPTPLPTIVLVGNPNVGKSLVLNVLSERYAAEVSNFPGTTVSLSQVALPQRGVRLMDSPGVYSLSRLNEEEQVTEQALGQAQLVLNVVAAPTLERDLFLTQQLLDWGYNLLVLLNQSDELPALGLPPVNTALLSDRLGGVPVLACSAMQHTGLGDGFWEALHTALATPTQGARTPNLPAAATLHTVELEEPAQRLRIFGQRRIYLKQQLAGVVPSAASTQPSSSAAQRSAWDKLTLHPFWGLLLLLWVLIALYQVMGIWVAGDVVNLLETAFLTYLQPFITGLVGGVASPLGAAKNVVFTVLAGDYGLFTLTPRYLFCVVAPLILAFNLCMTLLEDSGYLPRLAVLMDAFLRRLGLNGRAVLPFLLGFGCVTMAGISTRMLTSARERTIASVLLAVSIPCSAQMAVILGLMGVAGGVKGWLFFVGILLVVFTGLGSLLNRLLPGSSTPLVMSLPPLRAPQWGNAWAKSSRRSWNFLLEALPIFAVGSLCIGVAEVSGLLAWLTHAVSGAVWAVLHLPAKASGALLMGMIRRDFGLAGFYAMRHELSALQLLVVLVVMTLFVPCSAAIAVFYKERGWREGTAILVLSWVLAFGVGALVFRALNGWY
jgi:ferrous iron transport protein B